MNKINLSHLASTLVAYRRCVTSGNKEWQDKHEDRIEAILENLPHGSGIDTGVKLDWDKSEEEKLIFHLSFHHMDEQGGYDGWTDHSLTVTPSFTGFNIKISGPNRDDIKTYLSDIFYELFYVNPEEPIGMVSPVA